MNRIFTFPNGGPCAPAATRRRLAFCSLGLLLLTIGIVGSSRAAASPPTDWRWLLPSQVVPFHPFSPEDFGVAYGNGTFVGVQGFGAVASSTNGLHWTPVFPGTFDYFVGVAFGGGTFAAGWGGGISTSTNGSHWDHHGALGNDIELIRLRYAGGLFVATGREYLSDGRTAGVLHTSTNGRQWTQRLRVLLPDAGTEVFLDGIAHGNGRFVVAGAQTGTSSLQGFTYVSVDGVQWERAPAHPLLVEPGYLAFGHAGFVLLDSKRLLTSADGASWQLRHELEDAWFWRGIASSGERLVCLAERQTTSNSRPGLALVSTDGLAWQSSPMPGDVTRRLFSDGASFFALGLRSTLTSPDGINWTERFTPYPLDLGTAGLSDVVYAEKQFVAVGAQGTIIVSRDGIAWEKRTSGSTNQLTDVIHAVGRYVAAGTGGTLMHSTNGQAWTSVDLGGITLSVGPLAHGAGRFVLLTRSRGNGFFWTSEDGVIWRVRFSDALSTLSGFSSMTYGNGRFVAGGGAGTVAVSENGITWQRVVLPEPYDELTWIGSLIFDGERFLGTSYYDGLLASPDGLAWTTIDSTFYSGIGHGDGNFVAVRGAGKDLFGDTISLLGSSPDGASWTTVAPFLFGSSHTRRLRFTYGADRFVGVGTDRHGMANLLISGVKPPQLDLRREAAQFVLRIRGAGGSNWTLQHSATLLNWQTVGPITLGTEPLDIEVTPSTEPRGFWRLAEPER